MAKQVQERGGRSITTLLTAEQVTFLGANPAAALRKLVEQAMRGTSSVHPIRETTGALCDRCRRLGMQGCQSCPKNRK
jgi:hypothetical protein